MVAVHQKLGGSPNTRRVRARPRESRVSASNPSAFPLNDYLTETAPRFEHFAGRKATGIPVWVPVSLVAWDKLLARAVVETGFFVEVPAEGVRAKTGEQPLGCG